MNDPAARGMDNFATPTDIIYLDGAVDVSCAMPNMALEVPEGLTCNPILRASPPFR